MSEGFVSLSEGVKFVFEISLIERVEVDLNIFLSIADSGVLSNDLRRSNDVGEKSIVNAGKSSSSWSLLRSMGFLKFRLDGSLSNDNDGLTSIFLLKSLYDEFSDLRERVERSEGNFNED